MHLINQDALLYEIDVLEYCYQYIFLIVRANTHPIINIDKDSKLGYMGRDHMLCAVFCSKASHGPKRRDHG